ncbi:uncharacterized protein AB675_735 [Cyphellophora attinorum]|uniref:Uncharacterized protein n=1 Tax=Cyphellophora attinorum TaxID=1664694 RepID=A0A0N0NRV7_9EURO|nr:uncharacterized protein AB675_735 [Phialophora attinorum]KPI45538.1 hypothetical protein AB675_735 [Phialophora attinorum]
MAPSFSAMRFRKQDRAAGQSLDYRYGDAGISAANEGATWVEWARGTSDTEDEPALSPVAASNEKQETREDTKASITITINLPWQRKSKRSSSLPPVRRKQVSSPVPQPEPQPSRVSNDIPRSRVASPEQDNGASFSPTFSHTNCSRAASAPKKPTSPLYTGTPALSILSPLTESFDYPETPRTVNSDMGTSFENSPSSPFKQSVFDDGEIGLRRYHPPSPKQVLARDSTIPNRASPKPQSVSPKLTRAASSQSQRMSPDLRRPSTSLSHRTSSKHSVTTDRETGRYSPPPSQAYTRRARSVEPTVQRRHCSDDDEHSAKHHYRRPTPQHLESSGSEADDDEGWPLTKAPSSIPVRTPSPKATQGTYKDIKNDYSGIRRVIEADSHCDRERDNPHSRAYAALNSHPPQGSTYQQPRAARSPSLSSSSTTPQLQSQAPLPPRPSTRLTDRSYSRSISQPGSAGSGVSMGAASLSDEGYFTAGDKEVQSGPQSLVPSGEDLWG